MDDNLYSQTKLTEFAPLADEEKEQGVSHYLSKLFNFGRNAVSTEQPSSTTDPIPNDNLSQDSMYSWNNIDMTAENRGAKIDVASNFQYNVDVNEGRNMSNVVKRISNLLALKSTNLHAYADTELKQFWMPDSVSRECYECCDKFTTFRRKHHCRFCGQIFCSQCCNQRIPGKIVGCTGDLRACTYCCKVVLLHLQSLDVGVHLTADLRAFQEDLQSKFGNSPNTSQSVLQNVTPHTSLDKSETGSLRRKISIGYQEERFAYRRASNANYLTAEERTRALQNSMSLRNLYDELCKSTSGLMLQAHRYRLRSYPNCLAGSELVDWLISQRKSSTRVQATAICQALLEAGYLECLTEQNIFCDGYALYRPQVILSEEIVQPEQKFDARHQDEPSWMQQIPHESSTTDSEAELSSPCDRTNIRLPSSSSSYLLDLNLEESTVHLSRPPLSLKYTDNGDDENEIVTITQEMPIIQASHHREIVPSTGWHNAKDLRIDNGELKAYELLNETFKQHSKSMINQLLSANGLSLNWHDVIIPLVHEIVNKIRPDLMHDAEDLDIRHYIQFKKIPGGLRSECNLVEGIVNTKNVAHREMAKKIENPKILLLNCSLVYQRTEGRLMSLEPVILQEHEYLRNVAGRIVALQPNLVLVHKNVSRLAQDLLRDHRITLVLNVKLSILERLGRCTGAALVSSVDARMSRSKLGTCKYFYLKSFMNNENEIQKTLMFFEGLPSPHLGATVLLRGGSKQELSKIKQVASTMLFACYNWRFEKSFLMDSFAQPPNPKDDEFFGDGSSKESSPDFHVAKQIGKKDDAPETNVKCHFDYSDSDVKEKSKSSSKSSNDDKKLPAKSVEDFSDPLHCYVDIEDDVFRLNNSQKISVTELPFSNSFRKSLDETILSTSPYLKFSIPYLETESGRKCKLRKFYPNEIYFSEQFCLKSENMGRNGKENTEVSKNKNDNMNAPHPFISANLTTKISDSYEIQSLLANFRACGGRLPHKKINCDAQLEDSVQKTNASKKINQDVLELKNHQKLTVLICSYSPSSNNAPAFCVNPWVVNMHFYGQLDTSLGYFLETYCFRESYVCPSETCDTPMLKHVRRFVHSSGCISVSLNYFDAPYKEDNIVMWSWCSKCSSLSPVVPMSADTWSISFAKYLEFRFHGYVYSRRGNEACSHSLAHDHYQYFRYKNIVASFTYTSVEQWEVSLPPPLIQITYDTATQKTEIIDEIKSLALRGHEVFSNILEKLSSICTEGDSFNTLKQQMQKEHNVFKNKVDEVQLKLTSPTLKNKNLETFSQEDIHNLIWPLEDLMVQLKSMIVDTVETWNVRLADRKRDSEKRKEKHPSHVVEDTDISENESSVAVEIKNVEVSLENESISKNDKISGSETSNFSNIAAKKIRSLDHSDSASPFFDITNNKLVYCTDQEENSFKFSIPKISLNENHNFSQIFRNLDFDLRKFSLAFNRSNKMDENKNNEYFKISFGSKFQKFHSYPPDSCKLHIKYKVSDDNLPISSSPRGHYRSQSDGTVMTQSDDLIEKKELLDKKSVKTILSQLLPLSHGITLIQSPFSQQEHHLLPPTMLVQIAVYETEPSSMIAYALDSFEYNKLFDELVAKKLLTVDQTPSPVHRRKVLSASEKPNTGDPNTLGDRHSSSLLSFLWSNQKIDTAGIVPAATSGDVSENEDTVKEKSDDTKKSKPPCIEVEFQDANCNFCCRIYYAEKFMWLRKNVMPDGEEAYIRSLCRSVQWNARGGKSGSSFCKTKDDRFILKEMTKQELQQFLDSANNYFTYMERCLTLKWPTLLGKIVGVYQILFRNATTNANLRINLLVMENLFYNRSVTHKFDLKGSMRNRLVNPDDQDGEIVLLDENLLKRTCESPLYIYPHAKAVLTAAISSDTDFLTSQRVMDYSLLVGLDEDTKELVVGIIDYIRTFTWDKRLETMVKKAGILGGQGRTPTIIQPEEYQARFIEAMHRYFIQVPDRWTGLGKGLECVLQNLSDKLQMQKL